MNKEISQGYLCTIKSLPGQSEKRSLNYQGAYYISKSGKKWPHGKGELKIEPSNSISHLEIYDGTWENGKFLSGKITLTDATHNDLFEIQKTANAVQSKLIVRSRHFTFNGPIQFNHCGLIDPEKFKLEGDLSDGYNLIKHVSMTFPLIADHILTMFDS